MENQNQNQSIESVASTTTSPNNSPFAGLPEAKAQKANSSPSNLVNGSNSKQSLQQHHQKTPNRKLASLSSQNITPKHSSAGPNSSHERPLKCLETLAQKAGITFDNNKTKYDKSRTILYTNSPQAMDKTQNQAQQAQMPLQISSEQLQQLTHQFQLQQAQMLGAPTSIQVKQEFPNQQANTITADQLKQQIAEQNQVQQMQLIETATGSPHQVSDGNNKFYFINFEISFIHIAFLSFYSQIAPRPLEWDNNNKQQQQ